MTFSIIIASYGTRRWKNLGDNRAYPSAITQGAHEVIRLHEPDGTVASVRNRAAVRATGDFLVFLDADDELAPGYIAAMQEMNRLLIPPPPGASWLLTPKVRDINRQSRRQGRDDFRRECDLRDSNWLVIGTAVSRTLFHQVDGFDDREDYGAYEDWALWLKCTKGGAVPVKVPDAVYVVHWDMNSRHREPPHDVRAMWHYTIGHDHYPDLYGPDWLRRHGPRRTRTAR